ncbi:MAG: phage tail protein [Bryobacteraceae bacterium]
MATIFETKEQAVTDTPLLLFECELGNGEIERWSTHRATIGGNLYAARVLHHNLFEIQGGSDQGVDAIPRVSIALANADSHFSQIERAVGWKGSRIRIQFLFFDLRQGVPATESLVLFQGIANPPDEITETVFRLSAINRMNLQRVLLPDVRIQRRCPWEFPVTPEQREEAVTGGLKTRYSRFFRCGYSPDLTEGSGNLIDGQPYTSCSFTRADCEARGMFRSDSLGRTTQRFGGIGFVPASILVRSYGEKGHHAAAVSENEGRYNDFIPLIYGTAWYAPPIIFARNDGNLTRLEVLLGLGEINRVVKVIVNDIDVPPGQAGANMTGTGWFNIVSLGSRNGGFNLDFADSAGNPVGDPHGSMACLSVVVPNRVNDGRALPNVKVLLEGMRLQHFDLQSGYLGEHYTNNPAWVLLDILQRSGWHLDEIDLSSFAEAAAYCAEPIQTLDLYGNPVTAPRFQCNLVLRRRRSVADLIRGIRNGSRLFLTYGGGAGLLQLRVENTLALQQPLKPDWSNSIEPLDGGWPGYEFGDGTSGIGGILRRENGEPSLRLWSRSTAETPNRYTVEFQDTFNEYQQDSLSLVDLEDAAKTGQEISVSMSALGIASYDQAARILKFHLDKSLRGNCYAEFETSVKAIGLQPGDLISLTYLKEGFQRQPFRVLRIAPGVNFRTARITAQLHRDEWYSDTNGQVTEDEAGRRKGDAEIGLPRPLIGPRFTEEGENEFEITEESVESSDGGLVVEVSVGFIAPSIVQQGAAEIPLVSLVPTIVPGGGAISGNQRLYYAISALDQQGSEGDLSFLIRADIPDTGEGSAVSLVSLRFTAGTTAFNVYRGSNPASLFRIASYVQVASEFTDTGIAREPLTPPDRNFDHANFYWRLELQPEYSATIHSPTSIGSTIAQMPADEYSGNVVRIMRGKGAGQERTIVANTTSTLTLSRAWEVEPDATSYFTIAEAGWKFGASGNTSPVRFAIPNREGAVVQICGRAANVQDAESPYELSTITRWTINGAGQDDLDAEVAPQPQFGLAVVRGGTLELSGIGFPSFENTRTINAATLTLHYWNELASPPFAQLALPLGDADLTLSLTAVTDAQPSSIVQIDSELMEVEQVGEGGLTLQVVRGVLGSSSALHELNRIVYGLGKRVAIAPLVKGFFGSPASGNWSFPIPLPNARVAAAELFVTNVRGNSEAAVICLTQTVDQGLRTMSGGQISLQYEGFLAIETGTVPDLVIEATHSVRDVSAIVRQPPVGAPINLRLTVNGASWCELSVANGFLFSNAIDGFSLPPLPAGARLGLDILSVGQATPGADLTVTIRL